MQVLCMKYKAFLYLLFLFDLLPSPSVPVSLSFWLFFKARLGSCKHLRFNSFASCTLYISFVKRELLIVPLIKSPVVVPLTNFLYTVGFVTFVGENFSKLEKLFRCSWEHTNRPEETYTKKVSAIDEWWLFIKVAVFFCWSISILSSSIHFNRYLIS
jgi:hypothetical protein